LTKGSLFSGFSKGMNDGIFFFASKNRKRMSDFFERVRYAKGGSLSENSRNICLSEKISSENG
jgi:hypothetical protein